MKYKFCHISIGSFAHERTGQIDKYFSIYLIGSILTACSAVINKYLGNYLTIYIILS